jgi:hypothetical protein
MSDQVPDPTTNVPAPTPPSGSPPPNGDGQQGLFTQEGKFAEGWLDRLPADFIGDSDRDAFRVHALKYADPLSALKSDFHKERLLGKKSAAVLVPNEKSSPEDVAAFRTALGVPESADGYKFKPDQLPEGLDWDEGAAKTFAEIAHRHNVAPGAMRELTQAYVAMLGQQSQQQQAAAIGSIEDAKGQLKKLWGNDYDKQIVTAGRVAKSIGLDVESPGLGDPNVVAALARVAGLMSEDKFLKSEGGATLQSGKLRAHDIMTNPSNPLHADYTGKNGNIRQKEVAAMVNDLVRNG